MRCYSISNNIEGEEPLVNLFNNILDKMDFFRIVSAPSNTFNFRHARDHISAKIFFDCCITETYFNSAIDHLRKWKREAEIYISVFNCSWKYYALSRHKDLIKEYGYDESDYDENGDIKTSFTDEEIKGYSILCSWTGYNEIFLTSHPSDFNFALQVLDNVNLFSFTSMKNALGIDIQSKRLVDGHLVDNDFADEVLIDAREQHQASEMGDLLSIVLVEINHLVKDIEGLNPMEDNKDFFKELPRRIENLLNLEIYEETDAPF